MYTAQQHAHAHAETVRVDIMGQTYSALNECKASGDVLVTS